MRILPTLLLHPLVSMDRTLEFRQLYSQYTDSIEDNTSSPLLAATPDHVPFCRSFLSECELTVRAMMKYYSG